MPMTRAASKPVDEPMKPTEPDPEEQVELDEPEETMEEEVEYEEVEEEVEEEEEEEVVEEEQEDTTAANGAEADASAGEDAMKADEKVKDESEKHAELLALPPHGSELYIGGIPLDATEEDLKSFCEAAGEVAEIRLMKVKDSTENKGFAFVTFRTKELAAKAIEELSNTEFKGKKIRCSASQAKHRLFIGNVPRSWVEDNLRKVVTELGPGVVNVDLMQDPNNSSRNRGFAFVEYYNYGCADYSRKKMMTPKFKLDSNAPTVSWADPKSGDSTSNSQVKAVYVKNLPKDVTEDQLKKLFEHHGEITSVALPPAKPGQERRFGFVHFAERSKAMKAVEKTEKYELDGQVLDCSLAKPPAERRGDVGFSRNRRGGSGPRQPSRAGYGYRAQGFAQPPMYGRAAAPPGMAMVPMVLPDGRLAYVMQQPGIPVPAPPRGGGGRGGGRNNRGRRFQPY